MNVKLLQKVKRAILKAPTQFEMAWWFQASLAYKCWRRKIRGCGTAACIAGWVLHVSGRSKTVQATAEKTFNTMDKASGLLKLADDMEASRLFGLRYWPSQFRAGYESSACPAKRARIAAARINHFIKTKGRE